MFKTISTKLTLLYLFLTVINISFFTIVIFENQIELMMDNTKFKTEKLAEGIYAKLNNRVNDIRNREPSLTPEEWAERLSQLIGKLTGSYIIYLPSGEVYYKSDEKMELTQENIFDTDQALANNEFLNKFYYSKIKNKENLILFYVPLNINQTNLEKMMLLINLSMVDLQKELDLLYKMAIMIIVIVASFHLIFGIVLYRVIITPIRQLSQKSVLISKGHLSARVEFRRSDEIGQLAGTFNSMAESVQKTIIRLNDQNRQMKMELKMAAEVQKSIYPDVNETPLFRCAVYHRPFIAVSGDYHYIQPLPEHRYGVIIADISGHGVSAALLTMLIRDKFLKLAYKYNDSKDLLQRINEEFDYLMADFEKYFTAFYIIIEDPWHINFSNAGQPNPVLIRPSTGELFLLSMEGPAIGISNILQHEYKSMHFDTQPGDKIMLFTDGIIETNNDKNEQYSRERLEEIALKNCKFSCERMLNSIIEDFHNYCGKNRNDDETIIILEIKKPENQEKDIN
ncbi:MAG: SpoIIE family protein phosphatase [Spirochaetales bacterium]|nr:SpoIIE family protein phosphatase [Spirochaetales bacterium]